MNSTLLNIIFALPTHKWLAEFFDPIYSVFIPAFIVSMIISLPLAMKGRRKVLALLLWLSCAITVTLIFLGLTIPFGISFYLLAIPLLGPLMMAGSISLILTAEKTNLHFVLRFILSAFIVSGPFIFEKTLISYAKAKHDNKIAEKANNERLWRNITIPADLGGNIIYLPMRSTRIVIGDYERKKAFAKLAKKGRTIKLSNLNFGNNSRKEECLAEKYENPAFWCNYRSHKGLIRFTTFTSSGTYIEDRVSEASKTPDENGLIQLNIKNSLNAKTIRVSYLVLPVTKSTDAIGNPLFVICNGDYQSNHKLIECRFNFMISESLEVNFSRVRVPKTELAETLLLLKKDAEHIYQELQKRP